MEENQSPANGPSLPTIAAILYTGLALWSAYQMLPGQSSGGCDGGTCLLGLLIIPFYLLAYAMLLPAAFWLQRPRTVGGGVGATLVTLLALGIALVLGESGPAGTALLVCCWLTLAGLVLGFITRSSTKK